MKKELIYNFKSLLIIKEKISFSINYNYLKKIKIIKINNSKYDEDRYLYNLIPYSKLVVSMKTLNSNIETRTPLLIKHSIFNFYIKKYKITNQYLISEIEEYYRITKVFIDIFNKKYGDENQFEIDINHDVVFSILKYNENKFNNLEKYKSEKVENIFSKELFETIKRL